MIARATIWLLVLLASGCTTVEPWQRGTLAKPQWRSMLIRRALR